MPPPFYYPFYCAEEENLVHGVPVAVPRGYFESLQEALICVAFFRSNRHLLISPDNDLRIREHNMNAYVVTGHEWRWEPDTDGRLTQVVAAFYVRGPTQ
jgi:hypothetical protein